MTAAGNDPLSRVVFVTKKHVLRCLATWQLRKPHWQPSSGYVYVSSFVIEIDCHRLP